MSVSKTVLIGFIGAQPDDARFRAYEGEGGTWIIAESGRGVSQLHASEYDDLDEERMLDESSRLPARDDESPPPVKE